MNRRYMRTALSAAAIALVLVCALAFHPLRGSWFSFQPAVAEAAATGCNFPTHAGSSDEQTAWQIFVAANCSEAHTIVGYPLVWENWPEQAQVYRALTMKQILGSGRARNFHVSPLAALVHRNKGKRITLPSTGCGAMQGSSLIPASVRAQMVNYTICEEVHLNPEATRFILGNSYQLRKTQAAAAQKGADIQFPTPAIEVKVDWIPATDFKTPFSCSHPPSGIHVEQVAGTCYAMAGMHIESKLLKNWLWATFEPQFPQTNSLRCQPSLFGPCHDAWGARPAVSTGGTTAPTAALLALMHSAIIAPAFANYRLDGVQTQFVTASGAPVYLGNSIIEGENVGLTHNQASCITCHSMSTVNGAGVDGANMFATVPHPVGAGCKPSPGWIQRDFVWSMLLGVPAPGPTPQPSAPPACSNLRP